jgi:hypothetical protein
MACGRRPQPLHLTLLCFVGPAKETALSFKTLFRTNPRTTSVGSESPRFLNLRSLVNIGLCSLIQTEGIPRKLSTTTQVPIASTHSPTYCSQRRSLRMRASKVLQVLKPRRSNTSPPASALQSQSENRSATPASFHVSNGLFGSIRLRRGVSLIFKRSDPPLNPLSRKPPLTRWAPTLHPPHSIPN